MLCIVICLFFNLQNKLTICTIFFISQVSARQSQPVQEMGSRLLELAKNGDAEGVRELMNCGAPFSTDWVCIS